MTDYSTIAMRSDVKIWPQLLPFKRPISDANQLRFFVAAVFVSMVIHAFLAYLLCVVIADRTTVVGPAASSIDTPLIVSLVSLPTPATDPQDGLDLEVVSEVPHAAPPAQQSQSLPGSSGSIERKSEAEPATMSKDQGREEPKAPAGKSLATDVPPSIDVEAVGHIAQKFVWIPEFGPEIVLPSKGQKVMGPESPATASPSIDLEAAYDIAEEVARMSMTDFELQDIRELYLMTRLGIIKTPCPDCVTAYADIESDVQTLRVNGLLSIPFLLKDIITDSGYTLYNQEWRERRMDLGRLKDQERLEFMSNIINDLTFDPP